MRSPEKIEFLEDIILFPATLLRWLEGFTAVPREGVEIFHVDVSIIAIIKGEDIDFFSFFPRWEPTTERRFGADLILAPQPGKEVFGRLAIGDDTPPPLRRLIEEAKRQDV